MTSLPVEKHGAIKKQDRRTSKRISYVCEVECEGAGLSCLATRINDLSTTGAFIDSLTCYAPGTHLRLRFRINETMIETSADVRFTMPQMGMGVRFLDMDPKHQEALESLVEGKPRETQLGAEHQESGRSRQHTWNTPDVLLGNFAIVSMFDIIQLIENNKLTGSLAVVSPTVGGEIHFNDGQIVAANCGENGIEALKCFLGVTQGSFEFRRTDDHYAVTIQTQNNMSLMLDLLRLIDEEALLQS
jgi:hypothetical protein